MNQEAANEEGRNQAASISKLAAQDDGERIKKQRGGRRIVWQDKAPTSSSQPSPSSLSPQLCQGASFSTRSG